MTHIETLIMNELRKALEDLEQKGVGYIEYEKTKEIYYRIDNQEIRISVDQRSCDAEEES